MSALISGCFRARRRPLPATIAALFAFASPALLASVVPVSNCNDSGAGSLRAAAAAAANNDTIDLTGLSCSTITLKTGAISLPQTNITLNGPGQASLTVTGKYNGATEHDRIFNHTGTGTLSVQNLTVSKGYMTAASGNVAGGCIYSAGTAALSHVGVYGCSAYTQSSGRSQGGGVFGKTGVVLKYSVLTGNSASGGMNVGGYGGGVYANGTLLSKYTTISGNTAGNGRGFGGGALAYTSATIVNSTISGNHAASNGGGFYTHNFFASASNTTTFQNSTVSGNTSGVYAGGVTTNSGTVKLYNSTIVLNTAAKGRFGSYPFTYRAPGLALSDAEAPVAVTLQGNLIANNTYGTPTPSTEYDVSVLKRSATTVTFSGSHNLVRATFAAVPADTIKIACPLIGPLRNNGGITDTHALLSQSPGIDQGNNVKTLPNDQRGPPFARVDNGVADIGAYEVQHADIVFNNSFEGCPALF